MNRHRTAATRIVARHPSARGALILAVVGLSWVGAVYLLHQHFVTGPAQQSINVRWVPETPELVRQTAERRLRLGRGEQSDPDTWVYRLEDHSQEAIRQIVTHPLVADTGHIDRNAFRVRIDAPAVPVLVRRVLEADLGPSVAVVLAVLGLIGFWLARADLAAGADVVRGLPGVEVGVAVLALVAGFAFFADNGHGVDENIHYDQILRFSRGDWSLHPSLTVLPGFHALVAALGWSIGGVNELSARAIMLGLSVATVVAFHALARTLQPEAAGTRTLQFTFLPILFPQFFLIYTDVASLLFVVLMMLAGARRQYWSAGVLGGVSCLMRQNNVLWVAFVMVWCYLRDSGFTWRPIRESLSRYWTFVATGAGFLLFVALNNGQVALGDDAGSHPLGSLHVTNIFLLMSLSCFLFLPLMWGFRRTVLARLQERSSWLWLGVLFPLFWIGFVVDHPHNMDRADYFLPNAVLQYFSSTTATRLLFFVPVALAGLLALAVPVKKPWWLLAPFTALFLVPEWLVVPRYYMIPLTFFLLARAPASPWAERVQTGLFAIISVAFFLIIERGWGWV